MLQRKHKHSLLVTGMVFGILACTALVTEYDRSIQQSYIVQGHDLATLKVAVEAVGGEISHELGIINAVAVKLDDAGLQALKEHDAIRRVYADAAVEVTGKPPINRIVSARNIQAARYSISEVSPLPVQFPESASGYGCPEKSPAAAGVKTQPANSL